MLNMLSDVYRSYQTYAHNRYAKLFLSLGQLHIHTHTRTIKLFLMLEQ